MLHYSQWSEERKEASRISSRKWNKNNKEKRNNYYSSYYKEQTPEYTLLKPARDRAHRENVPFSIKESDIKINKNCPICDVIMFRSDIPGGTRYSPTMDKVIPELGYVPGNIAIICKLCNSTKGSGSAELHRKIASYIDSFTRPFL